MEYAELNVYDTIGGKKIIKEEINEEMDENDKKVLKKYRKRIIEQRNLILTLKKEIEELKKSK